MGTQQSVLHGVWKVVCRCKSVKLVTKRSQNNVEVKQCRSCCRTRAVRAGTRAAGAPFAWSVQSVRQKATLDPFTKSWRVPSSSTSPQMNAQACSPKIGQSVAIQQSISAQIRHSTAALPHRSTAAPPHRNTGFFPGIQRTSNPP